MTSFSRNIHCVPSDIQTHTNVVESQLIIDIFCPWKWEPILWNYLATVTWISSLGIFVGGVIKDEVVKSPGNTIKIVGTHCQDSQQLAKSGGTAQPWLGILSWRKDKIISCLPAAATLSPANTKNTVEIWFFFAYNASKDLKSPG